MSRASSARHPERTPNDRLGHSGRPAQDLPNADTPHKVITTSEYLARPRLFDMGRPKLVNLARSYAYQSKGYYASLLAEARGHRVVPTVETMLELREAKLYEHALPELEDELNRCARRADFQPEGELKLLVCFGIARDERFESFGRLLFDWFRCPALEVTVEPGEWLSIDRIRPRNITRLANGEGDVPARVAAPAHQARMARSQGAHASRNTISRCSTIRTRRCRRRRRPRSSTSRASPRSISVDVEPITKPPARRACRIRRAVHPRDHLDRQPHLPLRAPRLAGRHAGHRRSDLDDPLHQQGVPDGAAGPEPGADAADRHARRRPAICTKAMDELGLPLVVKIPDGSFSRGVHKVELAGGVQAHRRRAVRGNRPPAGAEIPADRVRLARRRARRRAAVRLPVPHGARPLADRQAPRRRLLARGRLPTFDARPGAARADRHRGARGAADRRRLLRRRRQGDRRRLHRDGGQRQPQPRARHRGPGRQGRDLDAGCSSGSSSGSSSRCCVISASRPSRVSRWQAFRHLDAELTT